MVVTTLYNSKMLITHSLSVKATGVWTSAHTITPILKLSLGRQISRKIFDEAHQLSPVGYLAVYGDVQLLCGKHGLLSFSSLFQFSASSQTWQKASGKMSQITLQNLTNFRILIPMAVQRWNAVSFQNTMIPE